MSFGRSVRIETEAGGGKPVIFWQQQANAKRQKKKFGYKVKEQKYPLRGNKPPAEEQQPVSKQQVPLRPVGKPGAPQNRPAGKPGAVGGQKPAGAPARKPAGTHKPAGTKSSSSGNGNGEGTVTLTKAQLDTILETIGALTKQNESFKSGKEIPASTEQLAGSSQVEETSHAGDESILNLAGNQENAPADSPGVKVVSVDKSAVPGLSGGGSEQPLAPTTSNQPQGNPPQEPAPQSQGGAAAGQVSPRLEGTRASVMGVPQGHLTQAERKRLQWERERVEAEASGGWNPWGRPGAGAPIRDSTGNVLADYNSRIEYLYNKQKGAGPSPRVDHSLIQQTSPAQVLPPVSTTGTQDPGAAVTNQAPVTSQAPGSVTSQAPGSVITQTPGFVPGLPGASVGPAKPPPAAIRSSFTLGGLPPNEDRYKSAKEREKQEWLADLERQREEKRLEKQREKERLRGGQEQSTWADRMTGHQPKGLPEQPNAQQQAGDRVYSAPTAPVQEQHQPAATSQTPQPEPSTFIRGQNQPVDPVIRQEMEAKMRRNQEHQDAIRRQIEEKERLKKEEREKRIKEELEEERKYLAQLEGEKKQGGKEGRGQRTTQEERDRQTAILKEAIDKAREEAEMEKHRQRMEKLRQGGHDTARLHASFQDTDISKHSPRDLVVVEPSYVPGLLPTPRDVGTSQRQPDRGPESDFAVVSRVGDMSRQSTDIIYEADIYEETTTAKPPPAKGKKGQRPEEGRGKKKGQERPGWGQPQGERKRPVKQSERDPHHEQRLRRAREKRAQLEAAKAKAQGPSSRVAETTARQTVRSPVPPLQLDHPSLGGHGDTTIRQVIRDSQRAPPSDRHDIGRSNSPPIPALKHKAEEYSHDMYSHRSQRGNVSNRDSPKKYGDKGPIDAPKQNGDFVPFVRSQNILDPAHAESPMPISREATQVERARKAYVHGHQPANFGTRMENYKDKPLGGSPKRDPLFNPGARDQPTGRQDLILQQLSDLRKGLLQKQRELEFNLAQNPPDVNMVA